MTHDIEGHPLMELDKMYYPEPFIVADGKTWDQDGGLVVSDSRDGQLDTSKNLVVIAAERLAWKNIGLRSCEEGKNSDTE